MNTLTSRWRAISVAAALVFAVLFPVIFPNPLATQFALYTLLYVVAVVGWNIFSGYSGYISLGHAVFFGVGAYTAGLISYHLNMSDYTIFLLVPVGGIVASIIAVPFGLIALRVRRHTFVVITIAIFFIFQLLAFNLGFTGGVDGVAPPVLNFQEFPPATFNNPFYYVTLAVAVVAVGLSWAIRGSRFGLRLLAIRDDEDRARGLGVHAMRVKLTAFAISAFFTGTVGVIYVFFLGQIYPQTAFNPVYDVTVALMAFFGGFGTLWGPLIGALILEPVMQYVDLQFTGGYQGEIFMGVLFLLIIMFLPRGLVPTLGEKITAIRAKREQQRQVVAVEVGAPPAGDGSEVGAASTAAASAEGAR